MKAKEKTHAFALTPNKLIESNRGFKNELEYKIFLKGLHSISIGKINEDNKVVLDISNMIKFQGGQDYQKIKTACDMLMNRNLLLYNDKNTKKYKRIAAVTSITYENGIATLEFYPQFVELVKNLDNGNFTKIYLMHVLPIKSIFSIRMYELLYKYRNLTTVVFFELDELRSFLNAKTTFARYSSFKARVLNVAKRDLKKYTDIEFTFQGHRTGKKFTKVAFYLKSNVPTDKFVRSAMQDEVEALQEPHEILVKKFILIDKQDEVLKTCSPEKIKYYYDIAVEAEKKKAITGDFAFYYTSILLFDMYNFDKNKDEEKTESVAITKEIAQAEEIINANILKRSQKEIRDIMQEKGADYVLWYFDACKKTKNVKNFKSFFYANLKEDSKNYYAEKKEEAENKAFVDGIVKKINKALDTKGFVRLKAKTIKILPEEFLKTLKGDGIKKGIGNEERYERI